MRPLLALVLSSVLSACGGTDPSDTNDTNVDTNDGSNNGSAVSACEDYLDAYNDCAETYALSQGMASDALYVAPSTCQDVELELTAGQYNCMASAYNNASCSSNDGWTDAAYAAIDCEQ